MKAPNRWVWLLIILYFLWPYDLLPDLLGPIGRIDDVLLAAYLIYRFSGPRVGLKDRTRGEDEQSAQASPKMRKSKTPEEVLDVSATADWEEIQRAYRKQVAAYHPDKVSHLGADLQKLAHEKMLEIQQAFEVLRHQKGSG